MILGILLFARISEAAAISNTIKMDHFGYRSVDPKIAYFTASPGTVEIHRSSDDSLAYAVPVGSVTDKLADTSWNNGCYTAYIDNDHVWWVDFSALTETGRFYILSTTLNLRSYDFSINDSIYLAPLLATLKAMYLQRCGTAHPATYAGNWADNSVCHPQDAAVTRACGTMTDYGTLNLSGGWHDAGDYNKYIGDTSVCGYNWNGDSGDALWQMFSAYDLNPTLFYDGQGNIPESGNGIPDILDECKWGLDWYLKMQMPDKHVLSVVHAENYTGGSPASTDLTRRYYFYDGTAKTRRSQAIWVACVAHGARIFAGIDPVYSATLKAAALATWTTWVSGAPSTEEKLWAAAEVFRMDPTQTAAKTYVDGYATWSAYVWISYYSAMSRAVITYIQASGATAATVNGMKTNWGNKVNNTFYWNQAPRDHYNSGIAQTDYFWSSNGVKADYGMSLVWGVKLGATGSYSSVSCLAHAEDFLHYLHGANPMNMVYMSGTQDMGGVGLGAKHGIYHLYHGWFGSYGSAFSKSRFIGKPSGVTDSLYPYYAGTDNYGIPDNDVSTYGPPPGFVVDGPTYQYHDWGCGANGMSMPPNLPGEAAAPYAKAYRDWNWVDPGGYLSVPWIVNETGIYYCTSYTLLAAQFQEPPVVGTPTNTPTISNTRTASPTATPSPSFSATRTPSATASPTRSATGSPSPSITRTLSSTASPSPSATGTRTATLSATPSPSPSPSPTVSPSRSMTPSVGASLSATPSVTKSPVLTPTSTVTRSATPSPSATRTATPTAALSAVLTPTSSATRSATPGPSGTRTATRSPTAALTATRTATRTETPTATLSYTPGSGATAVSTATFTKTSVPGSSESLAIQAHGPANSPNPAAILCKLVGDAESLEVKVYSKSMVCV
ncbi:MAG: glycoside hydrolase family 9 protein, partial [candidate division FCPU426 bacterium]